MIFVSIASYRDPQLVPTVCDCLHKARHPERLRFGICWQHDDDDELPDWFDGDQFRVVDVDYRDSRGACWARAQVMDLWDEADWYLQLDSHHRFAPDWDEVLLDEVGRTGSERPILTAYAPPFSPSDDEPTEHSPMSMQFAGFNAHGLPTFMPGYIADWEQRTRPHRARFLSGHFIFAPRRFLSDVPCDSGVYFAGEEITLTLRAFTHGYDLFEPSRVILWHEYTRADRRKHWDDHLGDTGPAWHERDAESKARIRRLVDEASIGPLELGTERTLDQYETYAGISFRYRKVQDYTRRNLEPPNPPTDRSWPLKVAERRLDIDVDISKLPEDAFDVGGFWHVTVHDDEGHDLLCRQVPHERLYELLLRLVNSEPLSLTFDFESQADPSTWTITPYHATKRWLPPVTGHVTGHHSIRPDARRPARVPGITWESAAESHFPKLPGDTSRRCELNSSGALLVELADGRQSVREIAAYLQREHHLDHDPVTEILDFYENACSIGLVTIGDPR